MLSVAGPDEYTDPTKAYGFFDARVTKQFQDIIEDLEETVKQVNEYSDGINQCIEKENTEIIPLVIRLNQGISEPVERVIRDTNTNALASLNRIFSDHLASLNLSFEMDSKLKDLVVYGYSIIEQEHRNELNNFALVLGNLTTTFNNKFTMMTKFFVENMTDLRSTWLSKKTGGPEETCCFRVVPPPDSPYVLHQKGYVHVLDLQNRPIFADPLAANDHAFLKQVLLYVSMFREIPDPDNDKRTAQLEDAVSRERSLSLISNEKQKVWLQEKVDKLKAIDNLFYFYPLIPARRQARPEDAMKAFKDLLRELPCFYPGEEKVPLLYCNEHVNTLVADLHRYTAGSYVGVRACPFHLKKLKEARFVAVTCVEKEDRMTPLSEPVFYVKLAL